MILYCDGASRGNPGPGAYGFVIFENNEIIAEQGERIGHVTNNVAEYQGLIKGLEKCLSLGAENISIRSDSELLVRQINGLYKVRSPTLAPLFEKAKRMLTQFKSSRVEHVRREENQIADALANKALDSVY